MNLICYHSTPFYTILHLFCIWRFCPELVNAATQSLAKLDPMISGGLRSSWVLQGLLKAYQVKTCHHLPKVPKVSSKLLLGG